MASLLADANALERARVPKGSFLMGREGVQENEAPVRRVFVSAFEIALTPVTNAQYRLYLRETDAEPPPWLDDPSFDAPEQPVVGVSWFQARNYCRWLSAATESWIRLPTEAEREKACRGGLEGWVFPWGDDVEGGGHDEIRGPLEGPLPIGSSPPNGYGLYQMADTVHEWCVDAYVADFYRVAPLRDPCAGGFGRRSARGGSWRHQIVVTACAARSSLPPAFHYSDFGFRWVRVLP